jgi:hypothetical protein
MKISEPIFIMKTKKRGYAAVGNIEGLGRIRRYGRSEEDAKEKFFDACNTAESGAVSRAGLTGRPHSTGMAQVARP